MWAIPGSYIPLGARPTEFSNYEVPVLRLTFPDEFPPVGARLTESSSPHDVPPVGARLTESSSPYDLRITYPDAHAEEPEPPAVVVAEEQTLVGPAYIAVVEAALQRGKVVLGFKDGRVLLESHHPFVKDFIRSADRMTRPGHRTSWLRSRRQRESA